MQKRYNYILVFLVLHSLLMAKNNNTNFFHLTMKEGLSNNSVSVAFKDSKGFMWFGTQNGLNKFDGYTFITYKSDVGNIKTLSGNSINTIVEDRFGQIWVGTENGLNKYDRETESFIRIKSNIKSTKQTKFLRTIHIDSKGFLWAFYDNGTEQFDPKTGKKVQLIKNDFIEKYLQSKDVQCVVEDKFGTMWMGTWFGGLIKLDVSRKKATIFKNNPKDPQSLPENTIYSLYLDIYNRLWVSTLSPGIYINYSGSSKFIKPKGLENLRGAAGIISVDKNKIWISQSTSIVELNIDNLQISNTFTNNPNNIQSITQSSISSLYKDKSNIIWIATGGGVSYCDLQRDKFSSFYYPIGNNINERYYAKTCYVDDNNNMWVGSFGEGLFYFDRKKNTFTQYTHKRNGIAVDLISAICAVNPTTLWLGTENGIDIFDKNKRKVIGHVSHDDSNNNSIYHNSVRKIFKDSHSNIWIVTQESLDLISGNKFTHFTKENLNGLSHYKITDIIEDKDGNIWIATFYGLNKYNSKTKKITNYNADPQNTNSLSNGYILSIYQDSNAILWISTLNGINKLNITTNVFDRYEFKNGNSNEVVYKILEDKQNNLWMLTASGIAKVNVAKSELKKYDINDGLNVNNELLFKDKNDMLFIGGAHTGIYIFNASDIKDNPAIPPIYISKISILNKEVSIDPLNEDAILQKSITETKKIKLKYDHSVIEFEIAALSYTLAQKNQYAYKLDGFDKDWVYLNQGKRSITYTNLDPGKYVLHVKGSNNDGVWNEKGVTLDIEILPPYWQTKTAYLIYFVIILALILAFRYYSLLRFNEKSRLEVNQMKIRFFTNISHEFRTPLTLISGPLSKLTEEVKQGDIKPERLLKQFSLMQRNSQRLMMLINQLLDLQKSETGKLKLESSHGDLISFIQSVFDVFTPIADQRNIHYRFEKDTDSFETEFDTDKMEKILFNLLSNAFKFTKDQIVLKFNSEQTNVIISVHDNGIGISKENLVKVFDNFFQVDNSKTHRNSGSGIGLALTRELITLHNGTIRAESELNAGTSMYVDLPFEHKTKSLIEANPSFASSTENEVREITLHEHDIEDMDDSMELNDANEVESDEDVFEKPIVLIVEDNPDLREYITDILHDNYEIIEAENGKKGVECAFEIIPDIIISDIMMPLMEGTELCSVIKKDERTSHIPVILLTALSAVSSKLKGYEQGADDYITKPFNADLLLVRVKNLIESRKQLQLKFQRSVFVNPTDFVTNVSDEKLLKKAIDLVEANLDNLDFAIQEFISGMNMSKTGIYKKIKVLTGQSVSEFIKSIRLRHAAQMLLRKEFTISEISYRVGFQSRTQFNRAFKEQFSMSPTEFIQKQLNS